MQNEMLTLTPIELENRRGRPVFLMLFTLVILCVVLSIAFLREENGSFILAVFLALFAACGVLGIFLFAMGFLSVSGKASRNDLTKAIVDKGQEAHLILDKEGSVLYANAAYQALCGGIAGRLTTIRVVERLFSGAPEISEATYRLAQAAREGRSATETMRIVPALAGDGAFAWYRVKVKPLEIQGGKTLIHWSVADITRERVRHENEFQELQQAISYLDNAPAGFFCADTDGGLIYINTTLAGWLDLDLAEIADQKLTLNDIISGESAALLSSFQGMPGGLRTETFDLDLKRRNGRTLPVRLLHRVAFAADGMAGVSRTVVLNRSEGQDVSEGLRAAEVRFARFFNNSPLAIATLGRDGALLTSNARFAQLIPPQQAGPAARDILSLVAPVDRAKIESVFQQAIAGKGEIEPVDATFAIDDGRSARFYFLAGERRDSDEEAALVYLLETTVEKKLQEQFAQSQKMSAIGQLAGGVAHDFNNHLQAILGMAEIMLGSFRETDPRHHDLMQIKSSVNRAKSLVRHLLDFSRQQTLRPEPVDLGEQLGELNNLLQRSIGPKVDLEVRHGRDLWLIHTDIASFDNMILNLAVNARDAMPQGGKLMIRTANISPEECALYPIETMPRADYVMVEITDTGTGMSPEIKKKIFEPFFTTKDVGRGTGLGLSSVYGFVKQSNGFIGCDSEVGKGTTFRVFLPRHIPALSLPDATLLPAALTELNNQLGEHSLAIATKAVLPDAPIIANMTGNGVILLVEDEDAVRSFGVRALRSRGYTVIEANSGVDALEKAGEQLDMIDLVISDVVMPEMDGPSLLRELRARKPELKVVFVSGYAEEAFRKNLPEGEQFNFLPKPFSLKQLVETVKNLIG